MTRRLGLTLFALLFELGCTKGFIARHDQASLSAEYQVPSEAVLEPSTDKMTTDCQTNKNFDACIFKQNPQTQIGESVVVSGLEVNRRFGVKVRGVDGSGWLQNSQMQILTVSTQRLSLYEPTQLKLPFSASKSFAEQSSAYYWANLTVSYLQSRLGGALVPISGLKIYVDDVFTGYESKSNTIHLNKHAVIPHAFNGDIIAHFIGEATASSLSQRAIFQNDSSQHKICELNPRGCCKSENGCAQSLAIAAGDYTSAIIFPKNPVIGVGLKCGVKRDLDQLSSMKKIDAYNACTEKGSAVVMGSWYSSLWWKLRKERSATSESDSRDIDILFFMHLRTLDSTSTFNEAKSAALSAASQFKNGKYTSLITAMFSTAGI